MKRGILLVMVGMLCLASCHRNAHFIGDRGYRKEVHHDFESRMDGFGLHELDFDTLNRTEREAMEFLYAYMPLSDLADYEPGFFLEQVRCALRVRKEMPWGKKVPEDVFRHFVLVYRVNNENLDTARMAFYNELKERVKGMTMEEAALEVNHWCHEHVAYRASDGRTSSPLATMRTSLGRCGEESTFAVTALRSVGIPARQCYTPRWAHCDDNHAWVEVWVDGKWKFMGACEPDPRLDMGWFSIPSTRCMMVHTKAFGKYKGDEEVVRCTGLFSELNLLSHYAPTRRVSITVQDASGQAVEGAEVKFKLYNYAEYYTLATMATDKSGRASLTTGLGDLLIWATAPAAPSGSTQRYAFVKLDVRHDSVLTLRLTEALPTSLDAVELEMVPPEAGEPKVVATEEETASNARRLAYEDSLRGAYTSTFPTKDTYKSMLPPRWYWPKSEFSDAQIWDIVHRSEGNYAEIYRFFEQWPGIERGGEHLYDYLMTFSDKDLRDITADVLAAHRTDFDWANRRKGTCYGHPYTYDVYKKGILPARISNEMVRPYRKELEAFKSMSVEGIRTWTMDSIVVDDTANYYNCPVSPVGVYRLRRTDQHSRDIFFVAACRAADIPAYLDNATNVIYVWDGELWKKVSFTGTEEGGSLSRLTLVYRGSDPAKPVYYPHFTLQRWENGDVRTFDFEDDPRMASFPATIEVEPGIYCLSTGNRYPDGAVRSRMEFFEVKAGERVTKEVVVLPLLARGDVLGILDKDIELFEGIALWDYAGDAGMMYVNLGDYSEPSKHLVVELRQLQKEVRQWGGMTFMVGPTGVGMESWGLANTDLSYQKGLLEQRVEEALQEDGVQYPLVVLIDKDGHILYHSEGYKIGVVEQVLKAAGRKI